MYFNESNPNHNDTIIKNFIIKCTEVEKLIDELWKKIILCNFKEGMQGIGTLFIQLETIINYADNLNKTNDCSINIEEILRRLTLLENAMTILDYVLIADLLKYEIEPIVQEWRSVTSKKFEFYLN